MTKRLERLREELEHVKEKRKAFDERIESLEAKVKEEEAVQVKEMVAALHLTPEALAALLKEAGLAVPGRRRRTPKVKKGEETCEREDE